MSGFKLLAVRPFLNCNDRFCKNLQKGEVYKFYNDYSYLDENKNVVEGENLFKKNEDGELIDNDVNLIIKNCSIPEELYNIKDYGGNKLYVSVSAVVGKNGSGKSTLLELIYILCYIIALKKGIIDDHSKLSKLINNKQVDHNKLFNKINEIQDVYSGFRAEIYYEIDGKFFSIWCNADQIIYHRSLNEGYQNGKFNKDGLYIAEDTVEQKFSFVLDELFFYSISINYSLYGLNSSFNNSWLKDLFHKNDGYQTPLVINPFRNDGNIDVNSELHLAQSRLLSNLVDDSFSIKQVVNGKVVDSILFTLDYSLFNTYGVLGLDSVIKSIKKKFDLEDSDFITKVYNAIYTTTTTRIDKINLENVKHSDLLVMYVYRKILKIYSGYEDYKASTVIIDGEWVPDFRQIFRRLIELKNDRSHITLKLRQVLNTIRFNILKESNNNLWKEEPDDYQKVPDKIKKLYFNLVLDDFVSRIKEIKSTYQEFETIELIPNACVRPTMFIKNGSDNKSITNFQTLSSGEQHFIHSIQSILYHISNINSVFNSDKKKIRYNYINLIFDEIELYYHPEFQRSFLIELLNGIKNLNIPNVKGINILFSSHSSFILSDIPKNSVLKLKNGKIDSSETKTFGANIHDILANDFFLAEGSMGKYAKYIIQEVIDNLNLNILEREIEELQSIEAIYNKELLEVKNIELNALVDKKIIIRNSKHLKSIIDIIDEPILTFKLSEMFNLAFPNEIDKKIARKQIEDIAKRSGLNLNFEEE